MEQTKEKKHGYYKKNKEKIAASTRLWRSKNKGKVPSYNRKSLYGITDEMYESLLREQKNVCAIHGGVDTKSLCVDHNHSTGVVRGLLCRKCNLLLAASGENIGVLLAAIAYLKKYNGVL
jgi:hypothetical protein